MPRHVYKKRKVSTDPIYGSAEVAKLINYVMVDGNKRTAEEIVYGTLKHFEKEGQKPLDVMRNVIQAVAPLMEIRPRRLGGASYQVPVETRPERKLYFSLNWLIEGASKRSNKEFHTFTEKLIAEFNDALAGQGYAIGKRQTMEKNAEANKVFAHLKW